MNELSSAAGVSAAGAGRILKLAVLAVGGQGGGVLTGWITRLAEEEGFHAQSTSVPGVAQRTGATIYYVEMMRADPERPDRRPIFALMPAEGDVDVVVAAELVEAGRAVLRRLVTPRTVLVASDHRNLTVSERMVPGDGRADPGEVRRAVERHARRVVRFDMDRIAKDHGTMISAALFGALAGSGALPFGADAFRRVVEGSGRGAERSLAAFEDARERAEAVGSAGSAGGARAADGARPPAVGDRGTGMSARPPAPDAPPTLQAASQPATPAPDPGAALTGPPRLLGAYAAQRDRVAAMPQPMRDMALRGLAHVVDYGGSSWGELYLKRLERALDGDAAPHEFSREAAKHLARAMAYDDLIRVADLKTRAARAARVRREAGAEDGAPLMVTEYFHPRAEEIAGLMPARLGAWLEARPRAMARLDRLVNRGRRVRTDRLGGFVLLWAVGGLRGWRRHTHRHAVETAHLEDWLALALRMRDRDPKLGTEVLRCQRLVKGYSDTHARGLSKFDRVLSALPVLEGRDDAADWLRRLRDAALQDEKGYGLDGALRTVRSFQEGV